MMVEAGGTEKAWDLLRGRRPEGHRRGRRRAVSRPARSGSRSPSTCSASCVAKVERRPRPDRADRVHAGPRLRRRRLRGGRGAVATPSSAEAITIADKAERNAATDAVDAEPSPQLAGTADEPGEFAGREKEIKEAARIAHQEARPHADRRRGHPHRRPRPDRPAPGLGRGRRARRPPTAPACSSGARPRC